MKTYIIFVHFKPVDWHSLRTDRLQIQAEGYVEALQQVLDKGHPSLNLLAVEILEVRP